MLLLEPKHGKDGKTEDPLNVLDYCILHSVHSAPVLLPLTHYRLLWRCVYVFMKVFRAFHSIRTGSTVTCTAYVTSTIAIINHFQDVCGQDSRCWVWTRVQHSHSVHQTTTEKGSHVLFDQTRVVWMDVIRPVCLTGEAVSASKRILVPSICQWVKQQQRSTGTIRPTWSTFHTIFFATLLRSLTFPISPHQHTL